MKKSSLGVKFVNRLFQIAAVLCVIAYITRKNTLLQRNPNSNFVTKYCSRYAFYALALDPHYSIYQTCIIDITTAVPSNQLYFIHDLTLIETLC